MATNNEGSLIKSKLVELLRLVFVLFVILETCGSQWSLDEEGCRTPDQEIGSCILVRNCEPMLEVLENAEKPLSQKIRQLLQRYQCGFQGNNPKVCCPSKPISIPGIIGGSQQVPPPPNVQNHRNFDRLPEDCGRLDTSDRIINGNKTGIFEFPWMALLSYRTQKGPDFRCGGSIINDRYILTAAHCISNLKYPLIGVRIGDHDILTKDDCELQNKQRVCAPPFRDLGIEAIIPHPDYNTTALFNDIGLVRVSDSMDFSLENVKPICLPVGNTRNYNFTNRNVIVTGWGATETGRASSDLLKVEIPIIPLAECQKTYANAAPVGFRQLCAGGRNNRDSCGGDSGGPLKVVASLNDDTRYIQQGVVSFGPRFCGSEGLPGVYTKVAYYMDWILDTIKP